MEAPKRRVAVVIYPGFDELDAIGPYETLRMAAEERDAEVRLVAIEAGGPLTASHGTSITPQQSIDDADWDVVIVPGGGWLRHSGAFIAADRGALPATLALLHRRGVVIASVCTGAMLLAAAGIVRGRPAITHHAAQADLRAAGAEIVQARVVDDGDVITSGGIVSGIDMALWLVERLWDRALADLVATRLEHHRVEDVHRGPRYAAAIGAQVLAPTRTDGC